MQGNKKKVNKESIIKTAVQLIDENVGTKNVTLRIIAKEIGCAHTNLYNYFGSLDEIYWEALGNVLLKLLDYSHVDENVIIDPEEKLFITISKIIDFSLDHPGWYKLIWFEEIQGEPSEEVRRILLKPSEGFSSAIIEVSKNSTIKAEISKEKAEIISNILWGYLHGELSKWINKRSFIHNREEMKQYILSNFKFLYESLIK